VSHGIQGLPDQGNVAAVANWRAAVELFFTREWDQLRTLILELEAEQWAETSPPASAAQATTAAVSEQNPIEDEPIRNSTAQSNVLRDVRTASFAEWNGLPAGRRNPDEPDRLAELAQNLERRLQATDSPADNERPRSISDQTQEN